MEKKCPMTKINPRNRAPHVILNERLDPEAHETAAKVSHQQAYGDEGLENWTKILDERSEIPNSFQ